MRYITDKEGLPRLKSGELCMSHNWVATIRALSLLPGGRARSVKQLAETAGRKHFAYSSSLSKRWKTIPRSLVHVHRIGARCELTLTQIGWQIVKAGDFGRIY
jgi:hypothetical protein